MENKNCKYYQNGDCILGACLLNTPFKCDEVPCDCIHKKDEESFSVTSVIEKMLKKFGEDSQIDVAIEEMSELIKELVKYKRSKIHFREKAAASREHVIEEMGDVLFMMEYLKTIFSISAEDIQKIIQDKAKRTKERYIDGEE